MQLLFDQAAYQQHQKGRCNHIERDMLYKELSCESCNKNKSGTPYRQYRCVRPHASPDDHQKKQNKYHGGDIVYKTGGPRKYLPEHCRGHQKEKKGDKQAGGPEKPCAGLLHQID